MGMVSVMQKEYNLEICVQYTAYNEQESESESVHRIVVSDSLQPHGLWLGRLLCPWDFPWQEYWSGLPFPTPGELPNPGIEPVSLVSSASALADRFYTTASLGKPN